MNNTSAADVRLNPDARVKLRTIGAEQNPLLIIDDVLEDPEAMVDAAVNASWAPPNGTFYPGVNADLPVGYLRTLLPVLKPSFERAFGLRQDQALIAYGFYALATWGFERFQPLQRIPHFDQPNPMSLAMVHYLCRNQPGGTAFFRHRLSGYESIDNRRRDGYMQAVAQEIDRDGERLTGFAGPDTPNYEMIDSVELRFNRLVIYRSNVLHCALFDGTALSDDPRTGRLTANSFFSPKG
ncbi:MULTISPECIES: DUF6445 family protein [Asticcacaulis]|uniref:DUF6445 family protein n=1 Tax=Asticcacaulis TaxID=76890 RepID=UPI001AE42497|nr:MULTISPECIES: DUF6445 family protein [Asticcacaulis]MBP2158083.1 hypothetical protein [Asticcacaulis solisilvae]MDR6799128.1 hypothetical protein [Asticcacaulis sp. BE141]